jgi:hypothetical protein
VSTSGSERGRMAAGLISRHAPVSRGRAILTYSTVCSGRRPLDFGALHRNFLRPGNDLAQFASREFARRFMDSTSPLKCCNAGLGESPLHFTSHK